MERELEEVMWLAKAYWLAFHCRVLRARTRRQKIILRLVAFCAIAAVCKKALLEPF